MRNTKSLDRDKIVSLINYHQTTLHLLLFYPLIHILQWDDCEGIYTRQCATLHLLLFYPPIHILQWDDCEGIYTRQCAKIRKRGEPCVINCIITSWIIVRTSSEFSWLPFLDGRGWGRHWLRSWHIIIIIILYIIIITYIDWFLLCGYGEYDISFFDSSSPFYYLLIEFHCIFSISNKILL